MEGRSIEWTSGPTYDASRLPLRVERVPQKGDWFCILLGQELLGTMTHWVPEERRTAPCPGYHDCLRCAAGQAAYWKGYILAHQVEPGTRTFVLEVTAGAGEVIRNYQEDKGSLRGVQVRLQRKGGHRTAYCAVAFGKERADVTGLPDVDITPIMERMFGARHWLKNGRLSVIRDEIADTMIG